MKITVYQNVTVASSAVTCDQFLKIKYHF